MDKSTKPAEEYRGVDINKGDKNKVSKEMVKEDTRSLNNNPRNGDMEEQ